MIAGAIVGFTGLALYGLLEILGVFDDLGRWFRGKP